MKLVQERRCGTHAGVHAEAGRPGTARELLQGAIARAEKTGETWYLPELHRLLGAVLAESDDDGVRRSYARARELAVESGALEIVRRAEADLGRFAA